MNLIWQYVADHATVALSRGDRCTENMTLHPNTATQKNQVKGAG